MPKAALLCPVQPFRFAFCFYLLLLGASAFGQEVPRIRNFLPAEYGGQNQNWALAQNIATDGWMYAGNNGGLLEFDGSRWQSFFLPEKQTIRAVGTGPHGEVFCGGFAEFGYWQTDGTGRFVYTSLSRGVDGDKLSKEEIWHILVGPEFVLFQSFSTIYKFDYQKVTVLHPPNSIMFARSCNGQVLLPVIGRGLYELLPDGTFRFLSGTESLAGEIIQFLVPNGKGGVWIGTASHGMFEWQTGQCQAWRNPLNAEFRQYQLNRAIALRDGGWAIGTILNGVYVLQETGNLRYHLNRENGLQNNTVLALSEDRDGNLWLGLDRGIDLVALHSPLTLFTDQSGKIGTVYTAAQWNGRLYIGTNQGVFVRESCALAGICEHRFQLLEGTQGQVWQLQVFDDQLFCGHNSGTFLLKNNMVHKISDVTGGWHLIQVPGQPAVLLQGTYTGLVVFRKSPSGQWQPGQRVGGFSEPLKKIAFDSLGYLWSAHPSKGLYRLRLSDDWSQVLEFRLFTRADGLPTDFKLDLATLHSSVIVNADFVPLRITTRPSGVSFTPVTTEKVRQKWLPGAGGDYFAVDSSGLRLFTAGGGPYPLLLSLVPSFENVVALSPGAYLFCLENGFARLNKDQLDQMQYPLAIKPLIRSVVTGEGETVWVHHSPEPKLGWRQNNLKFYFASPFFERPPQFSWCLEGFSSQWSGWQSNPEKEFASLPPGRYVLRLRTDTGGETQLTFRIAPPWYQSGWAWVLYLLLGLGLTGYIDRSHRRRLQQQRQKLEAEKERELARQRFEAETEKLVLEVENKSRELSNAAFNLIRKNEALQGMKDALLAARDEPQSWQKIVRRIDAHLEGDHDWEIFESTFNRLHDDFFKRLMLRFSDLTPGDMRLAAYLKMNLSSKEIAPLLNISVRGVENKRYRLRKKLGLP
ncbi:MAG: two-component regulator propeller domain-containing protein, partial [Saprospiraceae bacterium]